MSGEGEGGRVLNDAKELEILSACSLGVTDLLYPEPSRFLETLEE